MLMLIASSALAGAGEITEYPIPITTTPYGLTTGPDGKIWIVDSGNHVGGTFIGRMATNGVISESDLVQLPSSTLGLAATLGPDGNMWEMQDSRIDKIPAGVAKTSEVTEYPLGSGSGGYGSIVGGPDGRLWFGWNKQVGAITTAGVITPYPTSSTSSISGMTVGSDGKLWFGEGTAIARMDTSGNIGAGDEFALPSGDGDINDLALGPDGNIWFTIGVPAAVGRITPAGTITVFSSPTMSGLPFGIRAGADGRMWFVEENANKIASIPTSASSGADIVEYSIGSENVGAIYITPGPDHRMWFSEFGKNKLGAITTDAPATPISPTVTPSLTASSSPQPPLSPFTLPPRPPLPPHPAAIGCVANRLILTDVFPQGARTQVLGVAPATAIGKRVAIVSGWNGKTVALATVQADLSYKATVPLPPSSLRFTNRALYSAKLGRTRSAALKFSRRMYTTTITGAGATLTFAGTVLPPLAIKIAPITIRASASCTGIVHGSIVASVKPTRSGRFSASFQLPPSLQSASAIYVQAETMVRQNTHSKKSFPSFTLIRGVKLRP